MPDIKLTKIDNNLMYVDASENTRINIREYFSFHPTGYEYDYRYINDLWDGKIRLYNKTDNSLPIGILNRFIKFAKLNEYSLKVSKEIIDSFINPDYNDSEVNDYLDNLKISNSDKEVINLRDYQREIVLETIKTKRLTGISATSSGKSLSIYCIIRYFIDKILSDNEQIIIIVPAINLVEQMYSDFCDYSLLNDFNVFQNVTKIYAGKDRNTKHPVKISTWQSLRKEPKSYFKNVRLLVLDETHKAKAKEIKAVVERCVNADFRVGLTGTLDSGKAGDNMVINGLLGKNKTFITTKKLIDSGGAVKPNIFVNVISHTGLRNVDEDGNKMTFGQEVAMWRKSPERMDFVVDLVGNQCPQNTMILAKNVSEYIVPLSKKLQEMFPDRKIFVIHGKVVGKEREAIRQALETATNAILVCSYDTVGTGFSVKNLHHVIFAQETKSYITVIQAIGRGIRNLEGKTSVDIFDIVDMCEGILPYSYHHAKKRMKYYRDEGHEYKIIKTTI